MKVGGFPLPPDQLIQAADAWMLNPPRAGGAGQPGVPEATGLQASAVILPPDQFAPPGSQPLYTLSPQVAVVGPAVWAIPAAVVTTLRPTSLARIATFTCQIQPCLATSLITFILRVNGNPWPGMSRQLPVGPLGINLREFDVYVLTPAGAQVDILVQIADAAAYNIQAGYAGWVYSLKQQQLYYATLAGLGA